MSGGQEWFQETAEYIFESCRKHGIKTIFVYSDDCWNPNYATGKQPSPKPRGRGHNSGWMRDPGDLLFTNTTIINTLDNYVKDVITTFKDDQIMVMLYLYNNLETRVIMINQFNY